MATTSIIARAEQIHEHVDQVAEMLAEVIDEVDTELKRVPSPYATTARDELDALRGHLRAAEQLLNTRAVPSASRFNAMCWDDAAAEDDHTAYEPRTCTDADGRPVAEWR
jgi:hypothetical protein